MPCAAPIAFRSYPHPGSCFPKLGLDRPIVQPPQPRFLFQGTCGDPGEGLDPTSTMLTSVTLCQSSITTLACIGSSSGSGFPKPFFFLPFFADPLALRAQDSCFQGMSRRQRCSFVRSLRDGQQITQNQCALARRHFPWQLLAFLR